MGDKVLLVVAEEGDELVAGALNLIGGDTLYGRLWGCLPSAYYPSLHFEACYYQVFFWFTFNSHLILPFDIQNISFRVKDYLQSVHWQAIEAAIELNLSKVEAGAQGEHKIQRGYHPVTTYSCHYILDEGFRNAIGDFLEHEAVQV